MRRSLPSGVLLALATVIAITLAVMALPNQPLAVGLGMLAVVLTAGEIIVIFRDSRRRGLRDLNLDAHSLANELRALIQGMPTYSDATTRSNIVLENYRRRYAIRARDIALRLRNHRVTPTHYLYRLVSVGPQDEIEVWQVADGFDSLANQLVGESRDSF
jgi:hypothetical protein